jgi:HJR/Mrr/RecB family endonuclease
MTRRNSRRRSLIEILGSAIVSLLAAILGLRLVRVALVAFLVLGVLGVTSAVVADSLVAGDGRLRQVAFTTIFAATIAVPAIIWLLVRRGRSGRAGSLGDLLVMTPPEFELAVGALLTELGFRSVERVGKPGDLAADLRCRDRKGRSVVVQCKRHAPGIKVGSREVQSFIGMASVHHRSDRGIFVTTSTFTIPAIDLAKQHDIQLVDGATLERLLAGKRRRADSAALPPAV